MKAIVGCEESQAVTIALRKRGIEAYSCDLQDCSGGHPEWHIKGDVVNEAYSGKYDLGIFHPPCTYITNSGVSWLWNKDGSKNEERWQELLWARRLFMDCLNAPIPKIAVENPIPHKYAYLPKYSQIIQPYMFGHTESKATCLWLKGLPKLIPTKNVYREMMQLPQNERQRLHYLPPGPERAKLRSKTFEGIAAAMADQWTKPDIQRSLFAA